MVFTMVFTIYCNGFLQILQYPQDVNFCGSGMVVFSMMASPSFPAFQKTVQTIFGGCYKMLHTYMYIDAQTLEQIEYGTYTYVHFQKIYRYSLRYIFIIITIVMMIILIIYIYIYLTIIQYKYKYIYIPTYAFKQFKQRQIQAWGTDDGISHTAHMVGGLVGALAAFGHSALGNGQGDIHVDDMKYYPYIQIIWILIGICIIYTCVYMMIILICMYIYTVFYI